jgi:hypothetical protein
VLNAQALVAGATLGFHHDDAERVDGKIVHVETCRDPAGPAENAYVFVDLRGPGAARARYLTWINLYDIEHAGCAQPGRWSLCEPPQYFEEEVRWLPLGWGEPFPSVAD